MKEIPFWRRTNARILHIPMKKFLLSGAVLLASILYILYSNLTMHGSAVLASNDGPSTAGSPTGTVSSPSPVSKPRGQYADGTYTGSTVDAYYGLVQVKATIQGGKIADVTFLKYPDDRGTTIFVSQQSMPILKTEAIQAQNAKVDIVSGATDTSLAFQESLGNALMQAAN